HLQLMLVPFLSASAVDERLAEVEAASVLRDSGSGGTRTFDLVSTLNACFFDHPAFFEAREARTLQDELFFWGHSVIGQRQKRIARYRIEQRVTVADRNLLADGLIELWIAAPRALGGIP